MAEIANHKPVRLIDVADRAGVSRIVAGHVLLGSGGKTTRVSVATAQRVREAAKELDYRPNLIARQLSGMRTKTLAILIGADRYAIHYDRMRAIDREADRRGYRAMVAYIHGGVTGEAEQLPKQLDEMLGRGVEGVILMHGFGNLPKRVIDQLTQTNMVSCQLQRLMPDAHCIDVDIASGIEQLVDHLVERGRRRPALLIDTPSSHMITTRTQGFVNACKRHRLTPTPPIWSANLIGDVADIDEIRRNVDRVIAEQFDPRHCDAILASNDQWAVQVIKSLAARGIRVPDDVAVTGVDNIDIAAACIPEITTIDQCHDDIAVTVLDMLNRMIEGKRIARKDRVVHIRPKLIVRQST